MRYSRRFVLATAVLGFGGLLGVGCGGGGGNGSSRTEETVTASGRFTQRDATPPDLFHSVNGWNVSGLLVPDQWEGPSTLPTGEIVVKLSLENPFTGESGGPSWAIVDVPKGKVRRFSKDGVENQLPRYSVGPNGNELLRSDRDAPGTPPVRIPNPVPDSNLFQSFVNKNGDVACNLNLHGDVSLGSRTQIFVWKDGVTTVLPGLSDSHQALLIHFADDGQVLGVAPDAEGTLHLFTWQDGQTTVLPDPPFPIKSAQFQGINAHGDLLILFTRPGYGRGALAYCLFHNGVWTDLSEDLFTDTPVRLQPLTVLENGSIVCLTPKKLYTLTPR